MSDKITPEEAQGLFTRFQQDAASWYAERAKPGRLGGLATLTSEALAHALICTVVRERERCAKIAENPALFNREKGEKIRSGE